MTRIEKIEADHNNPSLRDNRNYLIRESIALLDNPWVNAENKRSIELIKRYWLGFTICRMNEFKMDRGLLKSYLHEATNLQKLNKEMHSNQSPSGLTKEPTK